MSVDAGADPTAEPPMFNTALEDALAYAADERERSMVLYTWTALGAEYIARERGLGMALDALHRIGRALRVGNRFRD